MSVLRVGSQSSGTPAYVGLGSNLGDGPALFTAALKALAAFSEVEVQSLSSLYLTEPQGDRQQPFFRNQVAALRCAPELGPGELLEKLLAVEDSLGRVREAGRPCGPRSIDLDLLLYGQERVHCPRLILPHPRMLERAFVLIPLAEIAPELELPQGMRVNEALARLRYRLEDGIIYQNEGDDFARLK